MLQIERVEKSGKRYYEGFVKNKKHSGLSVTSIIDLFDDKKWLERWWYSLGVKEIGEDKPNEQILEAGKKIAHSISSEASGFGTNQHTQAEHLLQGKVRPENTTLGDLSHFLTQNVKPYQNPHYPGGIGCEVPILYEKNGGTVGGTTDLVCELNLSNLVTEQNERVDSFFQTDKLLCVGDYKFPKKPKYNRDNIRYFLQLAAYRAGLNYTYDTKIDNAVLIVSPRSTKTLYLWIFTKEVLDYYQEIFDEMLYLHSNDCKELFDWSYFVKKAMDRNKVGMRVKYENTKQNCNAA